MAARRSPVLAVALLAAAALLGSQAFCGLTQSTSTSAAARSPVAREALPVEAMADASSVVTALQIQQPAWAANLVAVVLPITILITIYLQSERTLQERDAREGKTRM